MRVSACIEFIQACFRRFGSPTSTIPNIEYNKALVRLKSRKVVETGGLVVQNNFSDYFI